MNAAGKEVSEDHGAPLADQEMVAAFLSDPLTHRPESGPVERIDTHASMVFLAGDRAYKVKRALRYPYLDYGTLERRRQCCVQEVALNRRTAADLYLGVTAVTMEADGRLALGGEGGAIEWVVVMRRFAQDHLFDALGRTGRLTPALMTALADEIADFHHHAERVRSAGPGEPPEGGTMAFGGASGLSRVLEETLEELADDPELFPAEQRNSLAEAARGELERVAALLDERRSKGFVRRCHGDLHLRNICLLDERPCLFDGIEFNDDLTCIDTLYDLAFLLMDLEHRELRALGNLVLNRYLISGLRLSGLAALPLFLAARALVRAKVDASAALLEDPRSSPEPELSHGGGPGSALEGEAQRGAALRAATFRSEAQTYFREAARFLAPPAPCLIAIGGFSGSGKSSLARALAPRLGAAPGALILRSDVVRKTLFGVDETVPLPESAYRPEVSARVYSELRRRARTALAAGHAVVVDALHNHPKDRLTVEAVVREPGLEPVNRGSDGVSFHGFWLDAPPATLMTRIAERRQALDSDASDANAEVLARQLARGTGPLAWRRLDATQDVARLADQAEQLIRGQGTSRK